MAISDSTLSITPYDYYGSTTCDDSAIHKYDTTIANPFGSEATNVQLSVHARGEFQGGLVKGNLINALQDMMATGIDVQQPTFNIIDFCDEWRCITTPGQQNEYHQTNFAHVSQYGAEGGIHGHMSIAVSDDAKPANGQCATVMGPFGAIFGMINPIAGRFFGILTPVCDAFKP